ncbi:MAG TPA: ATP-binding cassette domain-containing protein [Nocardioides sp.]|jgi:ABC-type glutathione transport system ATPase component|nr:ATP-binding cassette domain-containing protein [Nocardioides sp.]
MTGIVEVQALTKDYGAARRGATLTRAVDDVSFSVTAGQCFGIVGESGSGKTTVAKMLLGLVRPTSGSIRIDGIDRQTTDRAHRSTLHRTIQVVFQDPYSSMNPRLRISRIVGEGASRVHPRAEVPHEVARLLEIVGLPSAYGSLYPHQLSGGQRQRVAIARALSVNPRVLVADEPVSALDVSMRGQVLNLLRELQQTLDLTCLFISHDLHVVRQLCDEIVVMQRGAVVERGDPERVLAAPAHPYTQRLLESVPTMPTP